MEILGCKTVADLQKVDVEKFIHEAGIALNLRVWAERDGRILPLNPYEAYADGVAKNVDFLQGCNKDEMGYFVWGFGTEYYNAFADERIRRRIASAHWCLR